VDAQSSIEESRLIYIRHNQHNNKADPDGEYDATDVHEGDATTVKDIRLPSSFIHSPAWSEAHVLDCLALRRKFGNITLFITFTANPRWPEIIDMLLPGQSATDRPAVTVRVFQQRVTAAKKILRKYFGPDRYSISVNEFQKRGLPHQHVAIALKFVPYAPQDLDQFLSGKLPREPGPVRDAILRHMVHQHCDGKDGTPIYHRCGYPLKKCQYGFPKPLREESGFDDRGVCQ
jgi:hypothetical protein